MDSASILTSIGGAVIGAAIAITAIRVTKDYKEKIQRQEQEIIDKATDQAKKILDGTRSRIEDIKKSAREENKRMEEQLNMLKKTLEFKSGILEKREQRNKKISSAVNQAKVEIRKTKEAIDGAEEEIVVKLKQKAGLDSDDAKKEIISKFDSELELKKAKLLQKTEEDSTEDSITISQNMLKGIIQRIGSPSSVDKNSTGVKIKNDKFKGLLIGKGGANIEYFESQLNDISIIFNLEPDLIYVGGLNLVNRNIAKKAIEYLKKEKRSFDKNKIKVAVDKAKQDIDRSILKAGRDAIKKAQIRIDVPEELVKLVGRLKYRTSFGQNVLQHSIEMAAAATMLASELGADVEVAKVATFFHDIGKAIDHEVGGSHDVLTKQILEKYNFSPEIVHAAYAHHDAEPQRTPEAMIVKAADAISAGRPGARQESLTSYMDRILKLEETAKSFQGVRKAYAISAGREIRIIVNEEEMKDEAIKELAQQAAEKIEEDLVYPGKIKVNVIRRTKSVDYAK